MTCSKRELEIQQLAIGEDFDLIIEKVYKDINKLNSSMELQYYLYQLTSRVEILASLKFGLEEFP